MVTRAGDSVLDADGVAIEVLRVGRLPLTTGLGRGSWCALDSKFGVAGAAMGPMPVRAFMAASPHRGVDSTTTSSSAVSAPHHLVSIFRWQTMLRFPVTGRQTCSPCSTPKRVACKLRSVSTVAACQTSYAPQLCVGPMFLSRGARVLSRDVGPPCMAASSSSGAEATLTGSGAGLEVG